MIRRLLVFAVFLATLVLLYVLARPSFGWDRLIESEEGLRDWIAQRPWSAFGVCFTIYVGISLIPGTTGKAIIAGWLFGFWRGLVLVNLGLTAAALISFAVARWLLRDFLAHRFGPRLARIDAALARDGANYLFLARVLHAPYCITNYVMGASRIQTRGFWWATQLGVLPANLVYVYAGAQAPSLREFQDHGLRGLLGPGVIAAMIAVTLGPVIAQRLILRLTPRRATAERVSDQFDE